MATTTTNVEQVKLNVMTQQQYNNATKSANELYMVVDAAIDYTTLTNKPTISNSTITITLNGTTAGMFSLNQASSQTINIAAQTTANLVTSVSSASTDSQYPSAKLFYDTCGDIETLINAL